MLNLKISICILVSILIFPVTISAQGKVVYKTIYSKSLDGNFLGDSPHRSIAVYLPPNYETNTEKSYPVIYLLHGYSIRERDWLKNGYLNMDIKKVLDDLIGGESIQPMIVVMPNSYNKYRGSWYTNSNVTGNWEDYIVDDLVGFIDSTYRTIPQRMSRGIAGLSMGGTGAFKLAMKHPQIFCAVFSLSAGFISFEHSIMGQDYKPWLIQAVKETDPNRFNDLYWKARVAIAAAAAFAPNKNRLPYYGDFPVDALGELIDANWEKWLQHDAYTMIDSYQDNLKQLEGIWIECGTEDDLYLSNFKISQRLDSLGIINTWDEFYGGHTDKVEQRIEQKMLPFLSTVLADSLLTSIKTSITELPSRLLFRQNYPNPFNPTTVISYQLPVVSEVDLSIYNLLGQKVQKLVSEKQRAGSYKVQWDASGFSSGVYMYRLETGQGFSQTKKLVLLK